MTKKMLEYVQSRLKEQKRKKNTLFGRDIVIIVDSLPEHVNLDSVLRRIETAVPNSFVGELDAIYVGDFELLKQRELQALYYHGTIYVTNEQNNENDLFDDLMHEISHAAESLLKEKIYADGTIEKEFLNKRIKMLDILEQAGYTIGVRSMLNSDYDLELDSFFYKEVGYDNLAQLIIGVYTSPYAITSLREYWAKGFEEFAFGNREELQNISPVLYKKLETVFSETY